MVHIRRTLAQATLIAAGGVMLLTDPNFLHAGQHRRRHLTVWTARTPALPAVMGSMVEELDEIAPGFPHIDAGTVRNHFSRTGFRRNV